MRLFILTKALVLFLAPHPASADWQYTRWGMSFSELQSMQGVTQNAKNEKHTDTMLALLKAKYVASGIKSVAYFYFRKSDIDLGLIEVRLSDFAPSDCASVTGILRRTYGNPDLHDGSGLLEITSWRVLDSQNFISFMGIINRLENTYVSCDVIYNPLAPPGTSGGF
ncbi:hypothetical protein [Natronohydrobacter thiooxidans]|uniref:hypothetical protein n=1 Tax=Natronohydrobacter thiooxidans TaxID=87172 RepID=UPI00111474BC|nr:hypothetical protein [Natronohydrobacter thiooxidans]